MAHLHTENEKTEISLVQTKKRIIFMEHFSEAVRGNFNVVRDVPENYKNQYFDGETMQS